MQRHVLLTLSTWAATDGSEMFPSIETLAIATGRNRETVRRTLERAAQEGWVLRESRARLGPFAGHRYMYAATVPRNFLMEHVCEGWESSWTRDSALVSERARKRHRSRQGRVTAADRDKSGRFGTVSREASLSGAGTVTTESSDVSLSGVASVPVLDRWNSSVNSSLNSKGTQNARAGGDEDERKRKAEVAKSAGMDSNYIMNHYGIAL